MITKIGAAALQQKDNADERPGLGHLATGLGGLGLFGVSAVKAIPLLKNDHGKLTMQEADQLRRMMGADGRLKETGRPMPGMGPAYNPMDHTVHANRTGYAYAHELGHATSRISPRKHRKARITHALLTAGLNNLAPMLNIGTTAGSRVSDNETAQKVLGAVDTATQAATAVNLAEEAQASIRALRAIHKLKGRAAALQAARILGPAFGTYLGTAGVAHGLVPWLTDKTVDLAAGG